MPYIPTQITQLLISNGLDTATASSLTTLILLSSLALVCWLSDYISKKIILASLSAYASKSENVWDDILVEKKVFHRIAHLAPALIIYFGTHSLFPHESGFSIFLIQSAKIALLFIVILIFNAFLNAIESIYNLKPISKERPIRGYVQILKIVLFSIIGIFIISILLGYDSPMTIFTGLGAMTAVLMLVFKDTIIGFVSSIQLSANNMVRIGDWITMPSKQIDGTVIEINLSTVKVQNWDKTISTIPTYTLVSDSFSNWRGMEESGGRRIKRALLIDIKSVTFCTPEMIEKYKKITLLQDYLMQKEEEIAMYNQQLGSDLSLPVNGRHLTNIGTFRKYIELYLKSHPLLHQDMSISVKQLQQTESGLPLEITAFCKVLKGDMYDNMQSDLFDHLIAVVPLFDLRLFQRPSGYDMIVHP